MWLARWFLQLRGAAGRPVVVGCLIGFDCHEKSGSPTRRHASPVAALPGRRTRRYLPVGQPTATCRQTASIEDDAPQNVQLFLVRPNDDRLALARRFPGQRLDRFEMGDQNEVPRA